MTGWLTALNSPPYEHHGTIVYQVFSVSCCILLLKIIKIVFLKVNTRNMKESCTNNVYKFMKMKFSKYTKN